MVLSTLLLLLGPYVDIFISARFGPGVNQGSHETAKKLFEELKKPKYKLKVYMVQSNAGDDFGDMTVLGLTKAKALLAIGCKNYGANTRINYSTYEELQYAFHNNLRIIALQLCESWPPEPDPDIDGKGARRNKYIFGPTLNRLDWFGRDWNTDECAAEIANAFHNIRN